MEAKVNKWCKTLAAGLSALALAGCASMGQNSAPVEDLLRAPRLSGDSGALQSTLNEWLGESAQLKYPLTGELLSPFLSSDWDGDGVPDATVLYTSSQTPNVSLAILQRNEAGQWQVRTAVEGLSDTVARVQFARLLNSEEEQLVMGYTSAQGDEYLAVYAYRDGVLETILEEANSQYLIEDITGSGRVDLVLQSRDDPEGPLLIKLLTADRESGGFRQVSVLALAPEQFTGVATLTAGVGAYSGHYVVLDGWTGVSGNSLASVLLRFNEETQQMEQAAQIEAQELYETSLRHVPILTSRDIDGDGVVEIPIQPPELGTQSLSQSRRIDFITWMDYTRRQPLKSFGLVDEEFGYYLRLPTAWRGDLLLTDGEREGELELRDLTGEKLYLTLRTTGLQVTSAGWTRLGIVANRQLQGKLGPDAKVDPALYRLGQAMHVL